MKLKEWLVYLIFLFLGASCFVYASRLDLNHVIKMKVLNRIQLLFVQHAKFATLIPLTKKNHFILRLYDVPESVIYFANQPNHYAGRVSVPNFISIWRSHKINPNVEIDAYDLYHHRDFNAVFSFFNPIYNAKTHVLEYRLRSWSNDKMLPVILGSSIRLQDVSLFIDHFTQWPP